MSANFERILASPLAAPRTQLTAACDTTTDTVCEVEDIACFVAPGEGELGVVVFSADKNFASEDAADYEVLSYAEVVGDELGGLVSRDGTGREWPAGTWVASYAASWAWDEAWEKVWEAVDLLDGEIAATALLTTKNNPGATAPPGASDDEAKGYSPGSVWVVDSAEIYVCVDATESQAEWQFINKTTPDAPPAPVVTD